MLTYFDLMKILAFSKVKNDPIIHFLYDSTYTSCTPIRFSPWIDPSVNSKTHEVRKNFALSPYLGQTKQERSSVQTGRALQTNFPAQPHSEQVGVCRRYNIIVISYVA